MVGVEGTEPSTGVFLISVLRVADAVRFDGPRRAHSQP
jgi:hypothetical protein